MFSRFSSPAISLMDDQADGFIVWKPCGIPQMASPISCEAQTNRPHIGPDDQRHPAALYTFIILNRIAFYRW
jgi:hypothetical protein